MKLLGWMHRKFRQNSGGDTGGGGGCGDPFREFIAGHACNCLSGRTSLDDSYLQQPRYSKNPVRPVHDQWLILPDGDTVHNIDYLPPVGDPDEDYVDEDAPTAAELFHGLLAIGTLGSGDVDSVGAVTPTFGGPAFTQPLQLQSVVDAIADKEEKEVATEADLMLINAELEKVLFAMEAAEDAADDDLNRLSSISAKQLVLVSPQGAVVGTAPAATCPLQEYLLGSTVGMEETVETANRAAGRERKDLQRRTSLGELFMKTRALEAGATDGTGGRPRDKDKADKTAVAKVQLIVKKMLMRRSSGKGSDVDKGGQHQHGITSSDTKFNKILQMFHRKVHPENLVAAKKAIKVSTEKVKNKPQHVHGGGTDSCFAGGGLGNNSKSNKRGIAQEKDLSTCLNCSMTLDACVGGRSANSSGNREHWIKTDADFLVLEL